MLEYCYENIFNFEWVALDFAVIDFVLFVWRKGRIVDLSL
jgi:hypothetical protein